MKIFKKVILFIIIVIIIALLYLIFNGYILYKESITEKSLADRIETLRQDENFTKFDEVPKFYSDAVIAIEDHRFFSHSGIDFIATLRAVKNNVLSMELKEGGSSITQQVAKNLCFTQEKTIYRKIAELFVVHDLEKNYKKEEIFELYINNMYFGSGYYNIYDASMRIL